ncbi:MAG TPA: helix-turn-helix domain-containing protein [Candidatus Limnocylindrales bacterium]
MEALRVLVQPGTGYDLLLSAVRLLEPRSRARVTRAPDLAQAASQLPPDVGDAIRAIGREPFISLLGWAHATLETPSAKALLDAIARSDPAELRLAALGYHRVAMTSVTPAATIRAAADGDAEAIREMRRSSYPRLKHWQATLAHVLAIDPPAFRDELLAGLRGWYRAGFGDLEAGIRARASADADVARRLLDERGLLGAIEQLAPGMTFAHEFGQDTIVLVPSVAITPGWALTDYGRTLVIAYPVMDRDTPAAQVERLAQLADALGDPIRIRAIRELRAGARTTSDLARRLGVPRTSLQHHLSVLIEAGIVAMAVDDASTGRLALRAGALDELARLATGVTA